MSCSVWHFVHQNIYFVNHDQIGLEKRSPVKKKSYVENNVVIVNSPSVCGPSSIENKYINL